jgi:hypothetical protein
MRGNTRGATAVEYAIVLPAFLMFVLGLMDCGRLIWTYATLSRAAESAARCWVINTVTCGTGSSTETYAVTQACGLGLNAASAHTIFHATTPACGKQVVGTLSFTFTIPWFYGWAPGGNAMTMNVTACYPT